jgi:hypothetical protein
MFNNQKAVMLTFTTVTEHKTQL